MTTDTALKQSEYDYKEQHDLAQIEVLQDTSKHIINPSSVTLSYYLACYLPATLFTLASLPFGSVHEIPLNTLAIALSLICLGLVLRQIITGKDFIGKECRTNNNAPNSFFSSSASVFLALLLLFITYSLIQSLLIRPFSDSAISDLMPKSLINIFLTDLLTPATIFLSGFIISYLLFTAAVKIHLKLTFELDSKSKDKLYPAINVISYSIIYSSAIIALIALGHWFSDNGRLFGLFESASGHVSNRARWPLVNSNHLGYMLLPALLLSAQQLIYSMISLSAALKESKRLIISTQNKGIKRTAEIASRIIAGKRIQKEVAAVVLSGILLLIVSSAVIATMSRAVWFAALLGLALISLNQVKKKDNKGRKTPLRPVSSGMTELHTTSKKSLKKVKKRKSAPYKQAIRGYSPITVIGGLLLLLSTIVVLFSLGAGQELISDRLAFGLLYTHDDMRWQFYVDSWPMLSLFGIGISQWKYFYPQFMDLGMAGFHLDYLHSDTMQLLIEFGFIGSGILIIAYALILKDLFSASLKKQSSSGTAAVIAIFLLIMLIPISFDFALRVPANLLLLSIICAFALVICDISKAENTA